MRSSHKVGENKRETNVEPAQFFFIKLGHPLKRKLHFYRAHGNELFLSSYKKQPSQDVAAASDSVNYFSLT